MNRPDPGGPLPEVRLPRGVQVRPARPSDARGALEHLRRVAAERRYIRTERITWSAGEQRRRFRRSWTHQAADIVAVSGGRVIGLLGIAREEGDVTRHVASLGMSVDAEWRSRGVGSALMVEAFRWARWAGVEKVALSVYPNNDRARGLYEKFGFKEEGRLTGHSKKSYGYEDEVIMGRWL